jgi:hypothetical protein
VELKKSLKVYSDDQVVVEFDVDLFIDNTVMVELI